MPRLPAMMKESKVELFWPFLHSRQRYRQHPEETRYAYVRESRTGQDNGGEKKSTQVHTCTTSKRIELESCSWSGLVRLSICYKKPDQPGLSSLIRLEVILDKRKIHMRGFPIGYQTGIKSCVRMHITTKQIELESPGPMYVHMNTTLLLLGNGSVKFCVVLCINFVSLQLLNESS